MGFEFVGVRLARLAATMLVISTVVFFVLRVIPGDPASVVAGLDTTPEELAAIRARLGTDRPVPAQYVDWLWDMLRLDLGTSLISGQPVLSLIAQRLPLTLALAGMGFAISLAIAVPLGILSAVKRWSVWDYAGMLVAQLGMALPGFWLGILLLLLFAVTLRWFPLFGSGTLAHLVLPSVALGAARGAVLLRLTRSSMIEELSKDYAMAVRAKGMPPSVVNYRHALRNALLPVITVAGLQLGYMLGGAIIIEQVFSLPGLGRLFLSAIYQRDFPLIQGGIVFVAFIFSCINFAADILYSVVNPRIKVR